MQVGNKCLEWKYFREDSKDAGFDGKEVYKYTHIWIENHSLSLLHLRYEKQINLHAKNSEKDFFFAYPKIFMCGRVWAFLECYVLVICMKLIKSGFVQGVEFKVD